jgi:Leucine-rich repeat (LRR) protein
MDAFASINRCKAMQEPDVSITLRAAVIFTIVQLFLRSTKLHIHKSQSVLLPFLVAFTSIMDTRTTRAPDQPSVDEHTQEQLQGESQHPSSGGRHPTWLPEDMHYLKGAFVGPTDSMILAPAAIRTAPHEHQQPTTKATVTNTNSAPGDSFPYGMGADSYSPTPGPDSNETVQVMVAHLVKDDEETSHVALQNCLPDTRTPGGRRLCFGIVALLVIGAVSSLGILCSGGACSPGKDVESPTNPATALPATPNPTTAAPTANEQTTQMPTLLPTTENPTSSLPTTNEPTTQTLTLLPNSQSPTNAAPTTNEPTTQMPTTMPTTQNPTSAAPATNAPTTQQPTIVPTPKPSTQNPTTKPTSTANPTRMQTLAMASDSISIFGTFYDILTTVDIDMGFTRLTGTLPTELGLMTALNSLFLQGNQLNGTLCTELGLMSALTYLDLSANELNGTLPTELGLMTALTYLDLSDNQWTGTLPTELGLMIALNDLSLDENELTGTLPTELGLMTSLTSLSLDNNHLAGTLAKELGLLPNLKQLWLSVNHWTGTIPSSYCNVEEVLDVCVLACPCSSTDCCDERFF